MNMSMSCCDGTIDIGAEWVSPVAMMSGIIGGGHGDTSLVTSSITLGGTGEECNGCSGAGCSEIESSVGAESTLMWRWSATHSGGKMNNGGLRVSGG